MSDAADQLIELGEDYEENYHLFLEDAIATGCVWGLENSEGWALCPSLANDDLDVMPLWSQPEYAKQHCIEEWSDYEPVPIALDELLDDWLPGMHEDVLLVGVNWNADMEGVEIEPLDLIEDVDKLAENMEE
ncbi:DUF2750 domain-containing protein [Teredinibacter sp. KSP-S5-2]|uniref:DUF2750 domain-containing protein n=1 Tax=Teredinibacter sp. KSP-S5-2 TaxID=3034506 RepID=UPI002934B3CD|nr:DUF2750 domain-containing protein [Teredinibacter sp. KSP-S5-2]WNO09430.1 DUF2750 domain-containing protein [Teredinibacter sp. KSP-S5-2]